MIFRAPFRDMGIWDSSATNTGNNKMKTLKLYRIKLLMDLSQIKNSKFLIESNFQNWHAICPF